MAIPMTTLELPTQIFTEEEFERLKVLLKGSDQDQPLEDALQKITTAAWSEYKQMLLGMGLPSKADEIQQYRLFHLITHYYCDRLPTEPEISSMFQLTHARSKSLLRSVITKFRSQLDHPLKSTLIKTIEGADSEHDEYRVVILSDNVVEELNRIIATEAPNLEQISKIPNTSRIYRISEDSYDKLCEHLRVNSGRMC